MTGCRTPCLHDSPFAVINDLKVYRIMNVVCRILKEVSCALLTTCSPTHKMHPVSQYLQKLYDNDIFVCCHVCC